MTAGAHPSVVVVGSFMMDLSLRAPRRPGPGETVVGTSFNQYFGGKGCNQALAAARAGASVAMVGRVGADAYGEQFLDLLAREGIDATCVLIDELAGTGIGVPLVEESGENSIVVVPRANDAVGEADIAAARAVIEAAEVMLLQLEIPLAAAIAAARIGSHAGTRVVLNPAPAPSTDELEALHELVDVLVPNEVELARLAGAVDDLPAAAAALSRQVGAAVVTTLGEAGSFVTADGQAGGLVPAHSVEVVDTVGAGDAYCGYLAARLAAGDDLLAAARWASAAGSISVTTPGAEPAIPRAREVAAFLRNAGKRNGGLSALRKALTSS